MKHQFSRPGNNILQLNLPTYSHNTPPNTYTVIFHTNYNIHNLISHQVQHIKICLGLFIQLNSQLNTQHAII